MGPHEMATRVGKIGALDRVGGPLADGVKRVVGKGPLKDLLSGTWLGHPLHPLLTDIPIGSLTSASLLDVLAGPRGEQAADVLVGIGVLSALPTAASGMADWSESYGAERRVGVVHAAANVLGVGLYATSLIARRRGNRTAGKSLGLLGMGVMTVGGHLGGYLGWARGVGVNNAFWQHEIGEWSPVLDDAALPEGTPVNVDVDGTAVLLYRKDGRVLAISSRCSHAGGPLHEGEIDREAECVTCPWHQSVFRLTDGSVVHGPASVPQAAFDVRVEGAKIQVRSR
jgi:nitrite reductase/ring-hydroxylating ferredoxin subunit/uncharacterized membrane protein